jgi:hypothetical protein
MEVMDWTWFLLGMFWGCFVGVFVMALVNMGKDK